MAVRILAGRVFDRLAELPGESINCVVTSPPYWGLRDYGTEPQVWGGDSLCGHEWGESIAVNATNHTDKRRWQHTRNISVSTFSQRMWQCPNAEPASLDSHWLSQMPDRSCQRSKATTPEEEGIELHPDAWNRFQRTFRKVVKPRPARRAAETIAEDRPQANGRGRAMSSD